MINGINDVSNPLISVLPVVLMVGAGYACGIISSKVFKTHFSTVSNLVYGNLILNFAFISSFELLGLVSNNSLFLFKTYTFAISILAITGLYFIIRRLISLIHGRELHQIFSKNKFLLMTGGIVLSVIVYQGIIIFYHPIFNEYDSIYLFLPISKSILLGNGLDRDYYQI